MLNENAKAWVAALRSGKFKQGHNKLARIDRTVRGSMRFDYCCLGVASELAVAAGIIPAPAVSCAYKEYVGGSNYLGFSVAEWLGLRNHKGEYNTKSERDNIIWKSLAGDNDDGKTFEEIANIIESEPNDLFGPQEFALASDSYSMPAVLGAPYNLPGSQVPQGDSYHMFALNKPVEIDTKVEGEISHNSILEELS